MNAITPFDMLVDALADRVAERLAPMLSVPQPTGPDLTGVRWNRKQVCAHLGIAERTLADREKLPSFPRRVNDGGRPQWMAVDIVAYGEGRFHG